VPRVVIREIDEDPKDTILHIFEEFENVGNKLSKSERVFIKINAVDFRKGCYTSPEILDAAIRAIREHGVRRIYVMDNSTQGNFTRLVFHATGIIDVVKKNGAKPLYLDEEKSIKVSIGGNGYEVDFPRVLYEALIKNREGNFYLNLPKLKTHTMTTVTLGMKNQMGLLYHDDRRIHHNAMELHKLIVDIYEFVRPDFTIIDGKVAIVNGHYPLEARLDKYIIPMNILIGGDDTVAVDAVGARVLGYTMEEVEHLKIAHERGLGCADLEKIEVVGDLSRFREKYPHMFIGTFPSDVKIVEGKEQACIEGCKGNTLMVLEMLHVDYGGHGPFSIVFGKGIDRGDLEDLPTPIMVVGPCAVDEVGAYLQEKYGRKNVVLIRFCNDLAAVTDTLLKFMGIKATRVVPMSPLKVIFLWILSKLHGSRAHIPSIF